MIGVGYVIDKSKWRKLNINIYRILLTFKKKNNKKC